jgi:hypothetical protein
MAKFDPSQIGGKPSKGTRVNLRRNARKQLNEALKVELESSDPIKCHNEVLDRPLNTKELCDLANCMVQSKKFQLRILLRKYVADQCCPAMAMFCKEDSELLKCVSTAIEERMTGDLHGLVALMGGILGLEKDRAHLQMQVEELERELREKEKEATELGQRQIRDGSSVLPFISHSLDREESKQVLKVNDTMVEVPHAITETIHSDTISGGPSSNDNNKNADSCSSETSSVHNEPRIDELKSIKPRRPSAQAQRVHRSISIRRAAEQQPQLRDLSRPHAVIQAMLFDEESTWVSRSSEIDLKRLDFDIRTLELAAKRLRLMKMSPGKREDFLREEELRSTRMAGVQVRLDLKLRSCRTIVRQARVFLLRRAIFRRQHLSRIILLQSYVRVILARAKRRKLLSARLRARRSLRIITAFVMRRVHAARSARRLQRNFRHRRFRLLATHLRQELAQVTVYRYERSYRALSSRLGDLESVLIALSPLVVSEHLEQQLRAHFSAIKEHVHGKSAAADLSDVHCNDDQTNSSPLTQRIQNLSRALEISARRTGLVHQRLQAAQQTVDVTLRVAMLKEKTPEVLSGLHPERKLLSKPTAQAAPISLEENSPPLQQRSRASFSLLGNNRADALSLNYRGRVPVPPGDSYSASSGRKASHIPGGRSGSISRGARDAGVQVDSVALEAWASSLDTDGHVHDAALALSRRQLKHVLDATKASGLDARGVLGRIGNLKRRIGSNLQAIDEKQGTGSGVPSVNISNSGEEKQ